MEGSIRAEALPSRARVLAELLAEQLDLVAGRSRLELEFLDGKLKFWWKHEKGGDDEEPG